MPLNPKPLALPTKLLQEMGAPNQSSASRTRGRWRSQDRNRKDRRKAERHSKKHRTNTTCVGASPTNRHGADDEEVNDEDPSESAQNIWTPRETTSPVKKRKREFLGDDENDSPRLTPVPKQSSRAVREKLAEDDAEIEQLERKLGLKKGRKSLPKAFKDDGLDDLLGGISDASDSDEGGNRQKKEARDWLANKRRKATSACSEAEAGPETDEDDELDDLGNKLPGHDNDSDEETGEEESDDDDNDNNDDDENLGPDESDLGDDDSFRGFDSDTEETARPNRRERENPYLPPVASGTQLSKYIPPSMRARSGNEADLEAQIRRKLQGPVNRVTEANMVTIVGEIERVYRDHPRGHTNNILTDLLMAQICEPANKPDTLLVLSAGFIAAMYKVVGVDFAAHFLTTSVERFQEEKKKAMAAAENQRIPTKETSNLITVLAELYIFRVISSILMFDLVRLLLGDLSELNAELLLRVVRVAGPQLRKDDPLALKDIVSLIRPAVAKIGESKLTVRTKFMIETISDLKNNKLKAGAQDLVILNEHVTRMRKVLGMLDAQKLKATEPMRIGLKDIDNADTTGKWWLVGASWAGTGLQSAKPAVSPKTPGPGRGGDGGSDIEDDNGDVLITDADDLGTPDYAQLAREQGMNTDVRRAIFIALVAAADYQDAYMRILKLRLNKFNRREVPNVLVQCSAAQQHYNPYYTLVAKKFCSDSRIKYAFQDTIWTLFRRLGEPLFGEEPEEEDEDAADDRRLINTARMIGSLVADGSMSLGVLKPLNLAYIKETTKLFVEVMLITVLQDCGRCKNKTLEQALGVPFGSGLAPELARSVGYFLRKRVRDTDLIDGRKEPKEVGRACRVAEALLQKSAVHGEG